MCWPLTLLRLATLALTVGACVGPGRASRSPLVDRVLRVAVRPAATHGEVEIHIGPYSEAHAWAVASGVRLVLADRQPLFLPFVEARRQQGRLVARCRNHPDHQVTVVIQRQAKGLLRVQVEDRVRLPSKVRELTLAYDASALGQPNQGYIIEIDPYRLLSGEMHVICTDTPNGKSGVSCCITIRAEIGEHRFEVVRPGDIEYIELIGCHCADRDRHSLQGFFTFLRGHDYLFDLREGGH